MTVNSILAVIVVFGAIVFFHELGHFTVAKLSGVRVYEFAIGFGPKLIHWRRSGTDYSLRILPLGGFVRLAGMDPAADQGEEVDEDDPANFNNVGMLQRMATIAAGPLMNFVLAAVLYAGTALLITDPPVITGVQEDTAAAEAGFQVGDQFVSINGEPVVTVQDVTSVVSRSAAEPLRFVMEREGERIEIVAAPRYQPNRDAALLGVGLAGRPAAGTGTITYGIEQTWHVTRQIVVGLYRMVTGQVAAQVAGPIGIFQLIGQTANQGWIYVLALAAFLNVNLGLLNLLPIPVLDGGWLLFLGLEAVRGKPVSLESRGIAQAVGLGLLLLVMLVATYQDITRLLQGFF